MESRSDVQLTRDHLNGDEQSLEVLIQRYLGMVYRFVYGYIKNEQDAQDITQETFVRAWRNLKKFDCEKNFKTWIFSIAKHATLDVLKKKKDFVFSSFEDEDGENLLFEMLADTADLSSVISEQKGIMDILNRAMGLLSPAYKRVLALRYREDMTFSKISEVLHEPLDTVKSRHRRGLVLLKTILMGPEFVNQFAD